MYLIFIILRHKSHLFDGQNYIIIFQLPISEVTTHLQKHGLGNYLVYANVLTEASMNDVN